MVNIDGQLDIFSFISEEKEEPPIWLYPGQKIYKVRLGELKEYLVTRERGYTYTYGDNGRGYRLDSIEGYSSGVASNESLGKADFTDLESALKAACKNRTQWEIKNDGKGVIYLQNITGYRKFRHKLDNGEYLYAEIGYLQGDLFYVKKWYCHKFVYPDKKGLYEKYLKEIMDDFNIKSDFEEMEIDNNYSHPCKWYTSEATGDVPMGTTMYWDTQMKCYREAENMCY